MFIDVFKSATTEADYKVRTEKMVEAIKSGEIKLDSISLRDIAEATLGEAGMRALAKKSEASGFMTLSESVSPVNQTSFSNITGQLIYQGVYDSYKAPEYVGDSLVTNETSQEDNLRVPCLQPIDDDAIIVEEGDEYSDVRYSEDWVDLPKSKKRGLKIGITREMVFFDRTGMALEMARGVGDRLGLNREKRILSVVLGGTNTYSRKGVAANTYLTSGNRVNEITQALDDWTSLDAMRIAFSKMRDDRTTPEPILVTPDTLIVNTAKINNVSRIMGASEVRTVTNTNITTIGANPLKGSMNIISSPLIDWMLTNATSSTTGFGGLGLADTDNAARGYWYSGQPKRAFRYRTLFPLQVVTATNDKDSFDRDVVAQFRADERGVAYVWAPWYMMRCKPA